MSTPVPRLAIAAFLLLPVAAAADDDELPEFTPSPPVVAERARLFAPPSVSHGGGPWACNVMTLVDEADCVFAGRVAAVPPRETNRALALRVGDELCERVARETEDARLVEKVRARCVEQLAVALPLCAGGATRLVDDGAHFGPEHAVCYGALLALVRDVRAVGQTWAPCCACLVDAGCSPSFRACTGDVARCRAPRAAEGARCEALRCENTCRATALLAPSAEPPRASAKKEKP
jgi:hypothetical protein